MYFYGFQGQQTQGPPRAAHTVTTPLGTTELDLLTNSCVKLRRQVGLFLNLLQSRANNRLWLRFRKYPTFFTLCVD